MSPAAAEFASACSAPGPLVPAAVVVVAALLVAVVVPAADDPETLCFEPPQPAAIPASSRASTSHGLRRADPKLTFVTPIGRSSRAADDTQMTVGTRDGSLQGREDGKRDPGVRSYGLGVHGVGRARVRLGDRLHDRESEPAPTPAAACGIDACEAVEGAR